MENFWVWVVIAVAAYAFVPVFRREVNSWIVKLADKVKGDTLENPKVKEQPDTHLLEDVAFEYFKADFPDDPRIAKGWHNLPPDVRKEYFMKAIGPLVGPEEPEKKAATQPEFESQRFGGGGHVQRLKFQRRPKPKPPRRTPPWLRRLFIILGIAAALLVIWTYFYLTTPAQAGAYSRCGVIRQHCVVDGDTLYVDGQKIRVADVDTPVTSEPKCASEKALGERATERMIELVNAGPFEVRAYFVPPSHA